MVYDLGALQFGTASRAYAINEQRKIAGEGDSSMGGFRALVGDAISPPTSLGTLPGGFTSQGLGINNQGKVVGKSQAFLPGVGLTTRAFISGDSGGGLIDLGTLSGSWSEANAISNSGYVAGTSRNAQGVMRAVRWDSTGIIRDVGGLSAFGASVGLDVNDAGLVVGWAETASGQRRAYRTGPDGALQDLGSLLAHGWSEAHGINVHGVVTGTSQTSSGSNHAFYYNNQLGMVDIHKPGLGGASIGLDINDFGVIVGRIDFAGTSRAFVWNAAAGMLDLNTLIAPDAGWLLHSATAINNAGDIVGFGVFNGRTRGFLIKGGGGPATVTPEPSTLVLFATGALLCLGVRQLRQRGRTV